MDVVVLNPKTDLEAVKLLAQIARADAMIVDVKAGARAEGFVLGMETVGALRVGMLNASISSTKRLLKSGSSCSRRLKTSQDSAGQSA